jgi:hypothetical protein
MQTYRHANPSHSCLQRVMGLPVWHFCTVKATGPGAPCKCRPENEAALKGAAAQYQQYHVFHCSWVRNA